MEAANASCSNCGEPLANGADVCPSCGEAIEDIPQRPRGVFSVLIILLIIAFALTGVIVRGYDARQEQLAQRWFARGNQDLANGAASRAVEEFQTALAFSRDRNRYRFKLALALVAAGRLDQAREHLLNLWERRPGDASISLELARVYARQGNVQNAIRYYHAATYGEWDSDPLTRRRETRFELAEYLLKWKQIQAAQAELIALSADSPSTPTNQLQLADLLLEAGEPERALQWYRTVIRADRHNADALVGAAKAAFALADYRTANGYGNDALRLNPKSEQAETIARNADAILRGDPQARGIRAAERARRTLLLFKTASADLQACVQQRPEDAGLQDFMAQSTNDFSRLREPTLARDSDLRDSVIHWSYQAILDTSTICNTPSGDSPVLLLAKQWAKER